MSINMYLGETTKQTNEANAMCEEVIEGMHEIIHSINYYQGAVLLQGKTYQSAKRYMTEVYRPIAQGIIYLCEELIRQNNNYPSDFKVQVATTDVVENELLDQLYEMRRIERRYEELSTMNPGFIFTANLYGVIRTNIQRKLNDLRRFNRDSRNNYEYAIALARNITVGLSQLNDNNGFNKKTGIFNATGMDVSWIAGIHEVNDERQAWIQYGDYLERNKAALDKVRTIITYEREHSRYLKQTNEFLTPITENNLEDTIEIKYLLYTADEPYRTIGLRYLDRFEIIDINVSGVFKYYKNTIAFDIEKDRKGERGSYYTFFHELAHAFDYYYGQDQGLKKGEFFTDTYKIDGKTLANTMHEDVEGNLKMELASELESSVYNDLGFPKKSVMINNIVKDTVKKEKIPKSTLTQREKELQFKMKELYDDKLNGQEHNTASDVYSGVTDKFLEGQYSHIEDYWFDDDGKRKKEPNREGFAEYYGRIMVPEGVGKVRGLDSIDRYLPKSKVLMDDIFDSMSKE